MLRRLLSKYLKHRAMTRGKGVTLWRKIAKPSGYEWADYLKKRGGFHSFGEGCYISDDSIFTDPHFTVFGNNVSIAGAWVSGHDASVSLLNLVYDKKLDAVGPVIFKDNVFIGRGVCILPGVTIGPNALVGAGAVISKDVPPNSVVAGNPARVVRTLDEHLEHMQRRSDAYPWRDIIEQREGMFDPALEPELNRQRIAHFFGDEQ